MADRDPANATPSTPVSTADVANASALVESISVVRQTLGDNSDAIVTKLDSIATHIASDIIGGTTGSNANRILVAKGTTGRALQPTATALDPSTGVISGTAVWNGSVITGTYGGTGINNGSSTITIGGSLVFSGAFTTTITVTGTTTVTFPTSGTLATLNTNTWAQQQGFARVSLTDAATIAWNAQTQQSAYVLLTAGVGGTRALGAPSNLLSGFTYILVVQQSSGGGNALTYNAVYKWPGGVAPVLSTAANAIDILTFVSDGTNMYGVAQKAFA